MKRPIGLILSGILLSLAALGLFLIAALTVFAGVFMSHQHSAPSPQMPHFFIYIFAAIGVFYLALAAWAALTVIGILRLRHWARYSILVIGAGTAVLSLMSIFGIAFAFFTMPQQPGVDPHITRIVFIVIAVIDAVIAAIGIWWFVYFIRRPIADLFRTSSPLTPTGYDPATGTQPTTYNQFATLPPPKPYTGFLSSPAHAPTAIRILGWLSLIGAAFCLPLIFLPLPAFILGYILPSPASHLVYLVFFIVEIYIGYGLLKLQNSARLAAIAFMSFGCCNSATSLLPGSMSRFQQYADHIMAIFPKFPNQPTPAYTPAMFVFNTVIGLAVCLFILGLLHYHRAAFIPPAEPAHA